VTGGSLDLRYVFAASKIESIEVPISTALANADAELTWFVARC
jgi:hypothetical protein